MNFRNLQVLGLECPKLVCFSLCVEKFWSYSQYDFFAIHTTIRGYGLHIPTLFDVGFEHRVTLYARLGRIQRQCASFLTLRVHAAGHHCEGGGGGGRERAQ